MQDTSLTKIRHNEAQETVAGGLTRGEFISAIGGITLVALLGQVVGMGTEKKVVNTSEASAQAYAGYGRSTYGGSA